MMTAYVRRRRWALRAGRQTVNNATD